MKSPETMPIAVPKAFQDINFPELVDILSPILCCEYLVTAVPYRFGSVKNSLNLQNDGQGCQTTPSLTNNSHSYNQEKPMGETFAPDPCHHCSHLFCPHMLCSSMVLQLIAVQSGWVSLPVP